MRAAIQLCVDCGSPLRPCRCDDSRKKRPKGLKAKSFSQIRTTERYGPLFEELRVLPCWLRQAGYSGPGHEQCGRGAQGDHTAHHVGREDRDGLLPGCGRAHDLYVYRGGRTTMETFERWLTMNGHDLREVALAYVATILDREA